MKKTEQEFQSRVTGSVCSRIQAQEYWFESELADEWNVLWMHLDDGSCLRFFFDAGVFFWKEEQPSLPPASESYSYRLVDPPLLAPVRNKRIRTARFSASPAGHELNLRFDGGAHVMILNRNDATSVMVRYVTQQRVPADRAKPRSG